MIAICLRNKFVYLKRIAYFAIHLYSYPLEKIYLFLRIFGSKIIFILIGKLLSVKQNSYVIIIISYKILSVLVHTLILFNISLTFNNIIIQNNLCSPNYRIFFRHVIDRKDRTIFEVYYIIIHYLLLLLYLLLCKLY